MQCNASFYIEAGNPTACTMLTCLWTPPFTWYDTFQAGAPNITGGAAAIPSTPQQHKPQRSSSVSTAAGHRSMPSSPARSASGSNGTAPYRGSGGPSTPTRSAGGTASGRGSPAAQQRPRARTVGNLGSAGMPGAAGSPLSRRRPPPNAGGSALRVSTPQGKQSGGSSGPRPVSNYPGFGGFDHGRGGGAASSSDPSTPSKTPKPKSKGKGKAKPKSSDGGGGSNSSPAARRAKKQAKVLQVSRRRKLDALTKKIRAGVEQPQNSRTQGGLGVRRIKH